jgi:hypothetical protein
VLNVGRDVGVAVIAAGFVEWFVIGVIIGAIYKPGAGAVRR